MRAERRRLLWPTLCLVLCAALAGSVLYFKKELRKASSRQKKAPAAAVFDKRGLAYFGALAALHDEPLDKPITGQDAARLAAYDRLALNKYRAIERGHEPRTFSDREPAFSQTLDVPLAAAMRVQLAAPAAHYRYRLTNRSEHAQPAPLLIQRDRWDSLEALIEQAGFQKIADETERAVAIWRYVCARRVFGEPPTEGAEEHDVMKFLACYGYGFCDDTARALATLAEHSGLRARVWELGGHVVAEVQAGGRWRMLDADQQAYFHRLGAPRDIYGVEDLAADRAAFAQLISARDATEYSSKFAEAFRSREDNHIVLPGRAEHRLVPVLQPGESITFTNYNWGRYFLGKYPIPPPRVLNGYRTRRLHAGDFSTSDGAVIAERTAAGNRWRNSTPAAVALEASFESPFPIVGGTIEGIANPSVGSVRLRLEDRAHQRRWEMPVAGAVHVSLDTIAAVLTAEPTSRFTLTFILEPGAVLELNGLEVITDFQFAPLALLSLRAGENEFRAHFPEGTTPDAFELRIFAE